MTNIEQEVPPLTSYRTFSFILQTIGDPKKGGKNE
jgi:hypothetical protein